MSLIFDHIGVFVKNLEYGEKHLKSLFPISRIGEVINDPLLKVSIQFLYDDRGICYELVAPNGNSNPVEAVLRSGKNILNHVAYKTQDFDASISHFRSSGCIPLGQAKPAVAFRNARVIFFLTPLKIIVELIEDLNA